MSVYWKLSKATLPVQWRSKQARAIYEAAIEAERTGRDVVHAAVGSFRVEYDPEPGALFRPFGTSADAASRWVSGYVAKLREEADKIERTLKVYGGAAFCLWPESQRSPGHTFNAEHEILRVLRKPRVRKIRIHGVEFIRDRSGAFVASTRYTV
jgi:hypothetical protein